MERSKKLAKENKIIQAAEKVFGKVGFHNAKMEDIAAEAGITKVTIYSYFQSKDNLYLAVIYNAFQALTEIFYSAIDENRGNNGYHSTLAIFDGFFQFCENSYLYSEAILDYFSLIRNMSRGGEARETSLAESIYFNKIQDIQNLPLKLTAKEMARGMRDGSIDPTINPMLQTIQGWTSVIGYIKLLIASGNSDSSLMHVDLKSLRQLTLDMARKTLKAHEK